MDDVVCTFPLLHLPIDALLNTLIIMNPAQIYGISLLSQKTKNLVESLEITADMFQIEVTDKFEVYLHFKPYYCRLHFKLYQVLENEPLQELGTPEHIQIRCSAPMVTWRNSMSVTQLIDHLEFIFHNSITSLSFNANCRFSLESIHRIFKNVQRIRICTSNLEQNRRVARVFQPAELHLIGALHDDKRIPRDLLMQNFDVIQAYSVRVTLDDLLVTNCRSITLIGERYRLSSLSFKILNRFLKLWSKGSNPQLEYMCLQFCQTEFRDEELLRGLKHQDAPRDRERFFETSDKRGPRKVTEGWDIWRSDGTQATVTALIDGGSVYFQLFVWHDHCVVNNIDSYFSS